jgi:hypothetical protein
MRIYTASVNLTDRKLEADRIEAEREGHASPHSSVSQVQ